VANARENARRNGVSPGDVEIRPGSIDQAGEERFEMVLANIHSSVLYPLLEPVRQLLAVRGRALFSGVLASEEQEFCVRIEEAAMKVEKVHGENDWICVVAQRSA